MSEIEKAIKYAEVRNVCAGEFNLMCGLESCKYHKTEFCLPEHRFMKEGEFNNIALSALQEKLDREKQPDPLSLEQLADSWRNGEPVYAKSPDGNPIWMRKGGVWCVLDGREVAGSGFQLLAVFGHILTLAQSDYGKTWIAYATKPRQEP